MCEKELGFSLLLLLMQVRGEPRLLCPHWDCIWKGKSSKVASNRDWLSLYMLPEIVPAVKMLSLIYTGTFSNMWRTRR